MADAAVSKAASERSEGSSPSGATKDKMKDLTKQQLQEAIDTTQSMSAAAAKLGIHYQTFRRRAIKFDLFETNQSGKGIKKKRNRIPLDEILAGEHPQYQTNYLRLRLLEVGIKENVCEECGVSEWNNKPLTCELEHIDGNRANHRLENLRMLCPNCHSQTPTFRNKKRYAPMAERQTREA